VLPGAPDAKALSDAFVLPALPDDLPLVLPGMEAVKAGDAPLVLPGAEESSPLLFSLEARFPGFVGDWMTDLTLEGLLTREPAYRDFDWS